MLTDDQARRYSRHVLLREVGGKGQQRLLAAPIRVRGGGTALEVAATYLAAGGSPIHWQGPEHTAFFLAGKVAEVLADLNPDARGPLDPEADVDPPRLESEAGVVLLGAERLAWFPQPVCEDCLALQATGRGGPELGALAALAMQRLVLGLESEPGALELGASPGADRRTPVPRCPAHG